MMLQKIFCIIMQESGKMTPLSEAAFFINDASMQILKNSKRSMENLVINLHLMTLS